MRQGNDLRLAKDNVNLIIDESFYKHDQGETHKGREGAIEIDIERWAGFSGHLQRAC